MKRKLQKETKAKQRLKDIDIDEISLVDKPAIDSEFVLTKSMKSKGGNKVTKKKIKKSVELKKGIDWASTVTKSSDDVPAVACKLCGISKKDEAEQIGLGMLSSTCFNCAIEHLDKGVLAQCLTGTFDADAFLEKNPDLKPTSKDEDAEGEGDAEGSEGDSEDEAGEGDANGNKKTKDGEESEDEESEDEGEGDAAASKADGEGDDAEGGEGESDDEESEGEGEESEDESEGDDESEDDEAAEGDTEKRVAAVEKNLADIEGMLGATLEMHEQTIMMMSQMGELTMGALELTMMLREESGEMSSEDEATVQAAAKALQSKIKIFRKKFVRKAGAKISAGRLKVLREMAEKLSDLISSVSEDAAKAKSKGRSKKTVKSAEVMELKKSVKKLTDDLTKSASEKEELEKGLVELANRLDDIEKSTGFSSELDDEDEDDSEDSSHENGSVFKGFGPLQAVTDRVIKSTRVSDVKK